MRALGPEVPQRTVVQRVSRASRRPKRTYNGYRAYDEKDLVRLDQIVALKFVGLPLRQIKGLVDRDGLELAETLRRQRTVLEAKRRRLDEAIVAIRQAEAAAQPGKRPDAALFRKIIEEIEMQNDTDWMMKYYNGTAKTKLAERRQLVARATGAGEP
ncbi:MAG: MerR family transcriptional regulator [Bryobacteraceae bacterium]